MKRSKSKSKSKLRGENTPKISDLVRRKEESSRIRKVRFEEEAVQKKTASIFDDRRFGSHDYSLTEEEKAARRFRAERILRSKGVKTKNVDRFNLNITEDDLLQGHMGDIDNENESFGGLKKSSVKAEDVYSEIIMKSKLHKAERRIGNEKRDEHTAKLDGQFAELISMGLMNDVREDENHLGDADDFEQTVRSLAFDNRVAATSRKKTPEEIALENSSRLEKLEKARRKRMNADEMSEDEDFEDDSGRDENGSNYKNELDENLPKLGSADVSPEELIRRFRVMEEEKRLKKIKGMLGMREILGVDKDNQLKGRKFGSDENLSDEEGEGEDSSSEESSVEDDADDDDADEESSSEAEAEAEESIATPSKKNKLVVLDLTSFKPSESKKQPDKSDKLESSSSRSSLEEIDRVPYVPEPPFTSAQIASAERAGTDEELTPDEKATYWNRLLTTQHPSLNPSNSSRLEHVCRALLFWIDEMGGPPLSNGDHVAWMERMDMYIRVIVQLRDLIPDRVGAVFRFWISSVWQTLSTDISSQGSNWTLGFTFKPSRLIILKMLSAIFPSSDFRHHVMTAAMVMMSSILQIIDVETLIARDALIGLFISELLIEWNKESTRYVPEVPSFWKKIMVVLYRSLNSSELKLAKKRLKEIMKSSKKPIPLTPLSVYSKSKSKSKSSTNGDGDGDDSNPKFDWLFRSSNDSLFGSSAVFSSILLCIFDQISRCVSIWRDLSSFQEIFDPVLSILSSSSLREKRFGSLETRRISLESIISSEIQSDRRIRTPLNISLNTRAMALKSHTPSFNMQFIGRVRDPNKERSEHKRLSKMRKREFKATMRDVRKDGETSKASALETKQKEIADRDSRYKSIVQMLETQQRDSNIMSKKIETAKKRRKLR